MDNQFLDAYIHLEKLCGEMYGANHGISKYIEDMEETTGTIQLRIPQWAGTYKKLKEIRWKRNQFVHEGNIEYDNADVMWLTEFYQQIMNSEDPLSVKYRMQQATDSNASANQKSEIEEYKVDFGIDTENKKAGLGLILAGVMIIGFLVIAAGILMKIIS